MNAASSRVGAKADSHPPLPGRLRTLLLAGLVAAFAATGPAAGQAPSRAQGWTFQSDAFAELWYHGLAVVGYYGFGTLPLYDPGYVLRTRDERAESGSAPTPLDQTRSQLLSALQSDEAFEVFHFIPAYFHGAGVTSALEALASVAALPSGTPPVRDPAAALGTQVAAQILARRDQRAVLAAFVQALRTEWEQVVQPRMTHHRDARAVELLEARWAAVYADPLSGFLDREGLEWGSAILASSLGAEGRFVPPSGALGRGTIVALSLPTDEAAVDAVLSSFVRELCYPAVRRAFEPFQARFQDRAEASRASDLAATRCGELLLERHAPSQLAAYRSRFGVPSTGTGRAFLSASGVPGTAAFEVELFESLEGEINIHRDGERADARPVGRN